MYKGAWAATLLGAIFWFIHRFRPRESLLGFRLDEGELVQSLREGVLIVDPRNLSVQFLNSAAKRLLRLQANVTPHLDAVPALAKVVKADYLAEGEFEGEIEIGDDERSILNVYGRLLPQAVAGVPLLLLVLYDVTSLRKLERMRTEFIANVSHELKTPITSIRGSAETLLDGALDNRDDAIRFLEMIGRQAERLSMIFDDMLTLSRVEQEGRQSPLEREDTSVGDLLREAVELCETRAHEKSIKIVLRVANSSQGFFNPRLVHQALVNLIDNAIKYSFEGGQVYVSAQCSDTELTVVVKDSGRGIAATHLPRLFERFYRVEQSRGRKDGGTGLGLAIVKHIAQAHGGRVVVESEPGVGSVFRLFIPFA